MRKKEKGSESAAESTHPEWSQLLVDAVNKPGIMSSAYSRFWNYSTGNQLLALWQCCQRGLELGPIHTFLGWKDVGRHVKKGERAITLCMPVTVKRKPETTMVPEVSIQPTEPNVAAESLEKFTVFTYRPRWFLLSQTDGESYQPVDLPTWSEANALSALNIKSVPFDHSNGNCQGFAIRQSVAVSPIAALPHKTLFHELAHVVLGHTAEIFEQFDDHEFTPRNIREVEAECVALICCESLGLSGAECCRGYVQHWLAGESISERSAQRIFKAADQILKAGYSVASQTANLPVSAPTETSIPVNDFIND